MDKKPFLYMNEDYLGKIELELETLAVAGMPAWADTIQCLIDNVRNERGGREADRSQAIKAIKISTN